MSPLDVAILVAFAAWAVAAGLRSRRVASQSLEEYFLAGRTLRGWQAGVSMAATQFAGRYAPAGHGTHRHRGHLLALAALDLRPRLPAPRIRALRGLAARGCPDGRRAGGNTLFGEGRHGAARRESPVLRHVVQLRRARHGAVCCEGDRRAVSPLERVAARLDLRAARGRGARGGRPLCQHRAECPVDRRRRRCVGALHREPDLAGAARGSHRRLLGGGRPARCRADGPHAVFSDDGGDGRVCDLGRGRDGRPRRSCRPDR